ncbi:MAG: HepT-like ribonuclease domain-containing protein, partial [Chloroflexota bacterium]
YLDDITEDGFKADQLRIDGVLFNLMIIGEAVKNLPDDMKAKTPEIQWRNIGRFRDRVVHHYFSTNIDIVWEIVQDYLPALRKHVETLLDATPRDEDSK